MPKVVFEDVVRPDMPLIYANSTMGGFGTRGDFVLEFIREFPKLEAPMEMTVEGGQALVASPPERGEIAVVREHVVRIVIPVQQVEAIGQWLLQQAGRIGNLQSVTVSEPGAERVDPARQ